MEIVIRYITHNLFVMWVHNVVHEHIFRHLSLKRIMNLLKWSAAQKPQGQRSAQVDFEQSAGIGNRYTAVALSRSQAFCDLIIPHICWLNQVRLQTLSYVLPLFL